MRGYSGYICCARRPSAIGQASCGGRVQREVRPLRVRSLTDKSVCLEFSSLFFFKQKTAYEIKECDWSSDVCSSDLLVKQARGRIGILPGGGIDASNVAGIVASGVSEVHFSVQTAQKVTEVLRALTSSDAKN